MTEQQPDINGTTVESMIKQQVQAHRREALKKIEDGLKTRVKTVIDATKVRDSAKADLAAYKQEAAALLREIEAYAAE